MPVEHSNLSHSLEQLILDPTAAAICFEIFWIRCAPLRRGQPQGPRCTRAPWNCGQATRAFSWTGRQIQYSQTLMEKRRRRNHFFARCACCSRTFDNFVRERTLWSKQWSGRNASAGSSWMGAGLAGITAILETEEQATFCSNQNQTDAARSTCRLWPTHKRSGVVEGAHDEQLLKSDAGTRNSASRSRGPAAAFCGPSSSQYRRSFTAPHCGSR